jgi:hypothetical protein
VKDLSQARKLGITISVVAVLIAGGFLVHQAHSDSSTPQLTKSYTNETYRFSLMMPVDFAATEGTEIDPEASTTVPEAAEFHIRLENVYYTIRIFLPDDLTTGHNA